METNGPEVSATGLGCMGLTLGFGPATNAGGADVELTAGNLASLDDLLARLPVTGNRYTQAQLVSIDR